MKSISKLFVIVFSLSFLIGCGKEGENPEELLVWGLGYDSWEYSTLKSIDLKFGVIRNTIVLENFNSGYGLGNLVLGASGKEMFFTYKDSLIKVNLETEVKTRLTTLPTPITGLRSYKNYLVGVHCNDSYLSLVKINLNNNSVTQFGNIAGCNITSATVNSENGDYLFYRTDSLFSFNIENENLVRAFDLSYIAFMNYNPFIKKISFLAFLEGAWFLDLVTMDSNFENVEIIMPDKFISAWGGHSTINTTNGDFIFVSNNKLQIISTQGYIYRTIALDNFNGLVFQHKK
jgi:hypothetical protein